MEEIVELPDGEELVYLTNGCGEFTEHLTVEEFEEYNLPHTVEKRGKDITYILPLDLNDQTFYREDTIFVNDFYLCTGYTVFYKKEIWYAPTAELYYETPEMREKAKEEIKILPDLLRVKWEVLGRHIKLSPEHISCHLKAFDMGEFDGSRPNVDGWFELLILVDPRLVREHWHCHTWEDYVEKLKEWMTVT